MPENKPDRFWDEYDWERFLQDQERRTEKYMGLIEKYMDHPDRDAIIAREMGWMIGPKADSSEWEDEVEASFEDAVSGDLDEPDEIESQVFGFEKHPLYRQAIAFGAELDEMFANSGQCVRDHPTVVSLREETMETSAKLAAALEDEDFEELGMNIAYLKRALSALTAALDAAVKLRGEAVIDVLQFELLRSRIFSIRDGIVSTMGEYRAEFRRRHGGQ
ncbi:MAG: hypothetical protein ABI318_15895 [Chthoniobacteraceae bacterium]